MNAGPIVITIIGAALLILFTIAVEAQAIRKSINDARDLYLKNREDDPAVIALTGIRDGVWEINYMLRGGDIKAYDRFLSDARMAEMMKNVPGWTPPGEQRQDS